MIIEQNVCVIVMLTKLREGSVEKADQYWPENGQTVTYSNIKVTQLDQPEFSNNNNDWCVRKFSVTTSQGISREVIQFHFTSWPDRGVPDPHKYLQFMKLINDYQEMKQQNGPMVVHCSAGVGRTGVFCLVHTLTKKLNEEKQSANLSNLKLTDLLSNMRRQRAGFIPIKEQYTFCYIAIFNFCQAHHISAI